jgi:DNA mismatch repair protein MutH
MQVRIGDRIVLESERVGQQDREGEILEVVDSQLGPNYRVRWDDGHVTEIRPKAGSARIVARTKGRAGARSHATR